MPRLFISNSRGRQQLLAGNKPSRLKEHKDSTYQEKPQKKKKGGAKYSATTQTKARRKQAAVRVATDNESTTSGNDSTDDAEAVDDDDDDTPEVAAPSRALNTLEAGRYQYDRSDDNLSEADDSESMFGGSFNPEDEVELNNRLMDDNDDDAYQAVDDISDSDIDDERIMEEQAKMLLAEGASELAHEDSEDPSFYLNQIEGMSAYGFGDESDVPFSSQASDSGNETLTRHVRFEETFPEQQAFRGFSDSPTMSRALLPSALPDTLMHSLTGDNGEQDDSETSDDDDSDLTDEDLPEGEIAFAGRGELPEEELPPPNSMTKHCRLPPMGKFFDDGVQSAGILDPSGSKLIITNPQTLGEEFARRYGASAPPSPGMNFAEAVLGTASNSPQTPNDRFPDPMLSGLTSRANATASGQSVGMPEAFFPPIDGFDAALAPFGPWDEEGSLYSELDEGERLMNIEDIVCFDTESDEEGTTGVTTSPMFGFASLSSPGLPGLSHITNGNIMSFRRNADPTFRAMQSSPLTGAAAARAAKMSRSRKPRQNKKRKATTESPYNDMYYKGVTPVQRVSRADDDLPLPASSPLKRQRIN